MSEGTEQNADNGTEEGRNLPDIKGDIQDVGAMTEYAPRSEGQLAPMTPEEVMMTVMPTASNLETTPEQMDILFADVEDKHVQIRQDGMVYLPWAYYAKLLRRAFGTQWAIVPESSTPKREGNNIIWGHYLLIKGVFISYALGEAEYHPSNNRMSWSDATESAVANALMRCCKRFGMGESLRDKDFTDGWRKKYAESYSDQGKTKWKKKDGVFADTASEEGAGGSSTDEENGNQSETPRSPNEPPDNSTPEVKYKYWRGYSMATATNLSMSDRAVTELCQSHFFLFDPETDGYTLHEGKKIPITEKKQLHWSQWKKLALNLHERWLEAGKPRNSTKIPDEAETETETEMESAAEAGARVEHHDLKEMIEELEKRSGIHGLTIRCYIETNYVADMTALPEDKSEGIKDFLNTVLTDSIIQDKVEKDIRQYVKWTESIGTMDEISEMIALLSKVNPDVLNLFFQIFKIKSLRGLDADRFPHWREMLNAAKLQDEENRQLEDADTQDYDADDDIPF